MHYNFFRSVFFLSGLYITISPGRRLGTIEFPTTRQYRRKPIRNKNRECINSLDLVMLFLACRDPIVRTTFGLPKHLMDLFDGFHKLFCFVLFNADFASTT